MSLLSLGLNLNLLFSSFYSFIFTFLLHAFSFVLHLLNIYIF